MLLNIGMAEICSFRCVHHLTGVRVRVRVRVRLGVPKTGLAVVSN